MAENLPKGYKKPTNGDRDWWGILVANWTRIASHNHDGLNSEKLNSASIEKMVSDVEAVNWTVVGDGTFKQTLNLPTGISYPKVNPIFYVNGGPNDGVQAFPKVKKLTATQLEVFVNDNSLALKVVYA